MTTSTTVRAETRAELSNALSGHTGRVGFVPTMGALHDGHVALIHRARAEVGSGGAVVVSIFVNPTQFAPGEDLDRYPRTLEADLRACAEAGADVVFTPAVEEMYPGGVLAGGVSVDPGPLGSVLEGRARPTHFAGVLTVVAKLLGLVRPDVAVFGQKDFQQLALIRRMATELCFGIEILGADTVREPDGLALSSRNRFLEPQQRIDAAGLSAALRAGQAAAGGGSAAALAAARSVLDSTPGLDVDYLEVTAPDLGPVPAAGEARMLVAALVGSTRLIDNVPLHLGATVPARSPQSPSPANNGGS